MSWPRAYRAHPPTFAPLPTHNVAEEIDVFPALLIHRSGATDGIQHHITGHREEERRLSAVENADEKHFERSVRDFVTTTRHNITDEERELLPALRASVSPGRLRELGQDFEARRVGELDRAGLDWSVDAR